VVTSESEIYRYIEQTVDVLQMRILPPLAMAYLLAFLDRGNIGNAVVAGLRVSIPMSDAIYNTGEYTEKWNC
jgi:hypothetical protein